MQEKTAIVVDHHPIWLEAISRVLETASINVVATTTALQEADGLLERFEPELVVVELAVDQDDTSGLSWLSATTDRCPELKVVVLSSSDDATDIRAALAAGANAYVVKKAHPEDLAVAVRQAYDRSIYIRQRGLLEQHVPDAGGEEFGLTVREVEILRLAAEGLSNSVIAKRLWVTEQTVKFHLSNIYSKLGVSNRTAASRVAQIHGLLLPADGAGGHS